MKKLILTEKPSVARDFAKALGINPRGEYFENNEYVITWAVGHLLTLKDPDDYDAKWKKWTLESLPIVPNKISYKPTYKTKDRLKSIKSLVNRDDVSSIVVATDAGREGELIARTILSYAKAKGSFYRFWTSQALSQNVILNGLQNLRPLSDYDRIFSSGKARQIADWIVGMNLSRLATLKLGSLFSVGRVQTAVLALLVDKRKEIESFKEKKFYNLKGDFVFDDREVSAIWFDPNKKEESSLIESEKEARDLIFQLDGKDAVISKFDVIQKSTPPPYLFSLTELQKVANRLYGFSAKKTLSLAQDLYEKYKCLSYPRTDSQFLGESSIDDVRDLLRDFSDRYSNLFISFDENKLGLNNKRVFDDSRLTDHHALIPLSPCSAAPNSDHGKVFGLVLKRFIAAFSSNFIYQDKKIEIKVDEHFFKSKGLKVVDQGWKNLIVLEKEIHMDTFEVDEIGEVNKLECLEKETRPPAEYTEATLLHDMINPARHVSDRELKAIFRGDVGLGTQATRAQIIETLINRGYIVREGRKLIATTKGIFLISSFKDFEVSKALTLPEETAKWESELEAISKGDGSFQDFLVSVNKFTVESINEWKGSNSIKTYVDDSTATNSKDTIGSCPKCDGNIIEGKKGFGCDKWKQGCKFVIWKTIAGKKISPTQAKMLLNKGQTNKLKGFKSKAGKPFEATLKLSDTGVQFEF